MVSGKKFAFSGKVVNGEPESQYAIVKGGIENTGEYCFK